MDMEIPNLREIRLDREISFEALPQNRDLQISEQGKVFIQGAQELEAALLAQQRLNKNINLELQNSQNHFNALLKASEGEKATLSEHITDLKSKMAHLEKERKLALSRMNDYYEYSKSLNGLIAELKSKQGEITTENQSLKGKIENLENERTDQKNINTALFKKLEELLQKIETSTKSSQERTHAIFKEELRSNIAASEKRMAIEFKNKISPVYPSLAYLQGMVGRLYTNQELLKTQTASLATSLAAIKDNQKNEHNSLKIALSETKESIFEKLKTQEEHAAHQREAGIALVRIIEDLKSNQKSNLSEIQLLKELQTEKFDRHFEQKENENQKNKESLHTLSENLVMISSELSSLRESLDTFQKKAKSARSKEPIRSLIETKNEELKRLQTLQNCFNHGSDARQQVDQYKKVIEQQTEQLKRFLRENQ
jgi:hypothetical protein